MRDLIIRSVMLLAATTMIASNLTINNSAKSPETINNPAENPLLAKWEGPYGGVRPLDHVQIALFTNELASRMAEQLAETDRIAKNSAAPDFENTIAALERTG